MDSDDRTVPTYRHPPKCWRLRLIGTSDAQFSHTRLAGDWCRFLPRQVLRNFFLALSGGTILWIIATDTLSEVADGFTQTAADLGQLRWAENKQRDHKDYD
jgi:hypothetical protein